MSNREYTVGISSRGLIQEAADIAAQLRAVHELEYHDKNWLLHGANPKLLNEAKRELLNELVGILSAELKRGEA